MQQPLMEETPEFEPQQQQQMNTNSIIAIPLPGSKMSIKPNDPKVKHLLKSNYISTTKYSIISFLPLGLLYQFFRVSNCYFLFMVVT